MFRYRGFSSFVTTHFIDGEKRGDREKQKSRLILRNNERWRSNEIEKSGEEMEGGREKEMKRGRDGEMEGERKDQESMPIEKKM